MFRSIGTVIVLLVLIHFFGRALYAIENAVVASFQAVEQAAELAAAELASKK